MKAISRPVAFSLDDDSRWGLRRWLGRHAQAALFSLGRLIEFRGASLMTALVIAVALALPSALYLGLDNVRRATASSSGNAVSISLHLVPTVSEEQVKALVSEMELQPDVSSVGVVSRAEALAEYRRLTGFDEVLELFEGSNPLGPVLLVEPADGTAGSMQTLVESWSERPEVESSGFDLEWVQRLNAIVDLLERGVGVLASFLLVGVALVIGNTIRLAVENRREEIAIIRLFGATDSFVRRPFLYSGIWQGLAGALIAWVAVEAAAAALSGPVLEVARLYRSEFRVTGLGMRGVWLVLLGCALGLLGAWLAVHHQLTRNR